MTAIEIRAVAYAIAAGIMFMLGYHVAAEHYTALANATKVAQDTVVQKAQADLSAALADRVQLQQKVAQQNDDLQKSNAALSDSVVSSVRNLGAAIRAGSVFSAVANSGTGSGAAAGAGSDPRIKQAFADVGSAIDAATVACLHDSRELQVIQDAAPPTPQPARQ